ncbi:MAG: glycoside hydrolase [Clostridia bacterium]|nr:glycoside hydrolase [Clostridia bacterium]
MKFTNEDLGCFAKDPAVIEWKGDTYLYHSIYEKGTNILGIGIARLEDEDTFVRIAEFERTQPCEQNGVGAPGAIVLDGVIHLFYQTYGNGPLDAICHATSTDGIHFTKDASNPVFAPREPWADMPEWSCGRAIDADVCVCGDRLLLYFATRDKAFERQIVGAAWAPLTSDFSRGTWTLHPDLILEPTLLWEKTCIEAPAALFHDGKVYLFYAGAYNCAPQWIGCAVSDDGLHFTRLFCEEPLLKNGAPGSWNASESGHPYIYRANNARADNNARAEDGILWLYYQGSPDMGKTWYLSRCSVVIKDAKPQLVEPQR